MKQVKRIVSYVGESEYVEGRTKLNLEQQEILKEISSILNYSNDNYDNLPLSYAPVGLIRVLHDQVKAKIGYHNINKEKENNALSLIDLLEQQLLAENIE